VPALKAVVVHGDASQRGEALDALARIGRARARRIVEHVKRETTDQDEREHAAAPRKLAELFQATSRHRLELSASVEKGHSRVQLSDIRYADQRRSASRD
jgi:hypothetical protein